MRKMFAICPIFLPFVAGCLAFGGDGGTPNGMAAVNWETALTIYGPMGGIIVWFMIREKKRDERLFALVEKCTDVIAKVEDALAKSSADDEKLRVVTYRLRDDVRGLASAAHHGKTRITHRDEEE